VRVCRKGQRGLRYLRNVTGDMVSILKTRMGKKEYGEEITTFTSYRNFQISNFYISVLEFALGYLRSFYQL